MSCVYTLKITLTTRTRHHSSTQRMNTVHTKPYVHGILNKNRTILARTITLVESQRPDHQEAVQHILTQLLPYTGNAYRIGITGVPGVGKSSFIETLGTHITQKGYTVAILAVDPSSARTGGSILADKTRMQNLSNNGQAFIRPSPSSGTLGGVARKTRETMLLCEAFGFDVILVETVGVGQSETAVVDMVDSFLVLLLANAGDEIQGIKKGVLEYADMIVVNKADSKNITPAQRAVQVYRRALRLMMPISPNWSPPVLMCSSLEGTGIPEVWQNITQHHLTLSNSGELKLKREQQQIQWMWTLFQEDLHQLLNQQHDNTQNIQNIENSVRQGFITVPVAVKALLKIITQKLLQNLEKTNS